MEKKIEEIVHAFGEEMEHIVFNSNGKAKTMDLAKAWLRSRLEELGSVPNQLDLILSC